MMFCVGIWACSWCIAVRGLWPTSQDVAGPSECRVVAVRPEGANHQWRRNPPGELSIDPVADERLVRVTAWVGAS
jgi:hypothetical protein